MYVGNKLNLFCTVCEMGLSALNAKVQFLQGISLYVVTLVNSFIQSSFCK